MNINQEIDIDNGTITWSWTGSPCAILYNVNVLVDGMVISSASQHNSSTFQLPIQPNFYGSSIYCTVQPMNLFGTPGELSQSQVHLISMCTLN